jgi:hypothetical protein
MTKRIRLTWAAVAAAALTAVVTATPAIVAGISFNFLD